MVSTRVLVVVRDAEARESLSTGLNNAGYEIVAVSNGKGVLNDLGSFDAAVIDTGIEEPDGFELGKRVKSAAEGAFVPVILIGTDDTVEERVRGFTLGLDDFMMPPVSVFELDARLRSLLARRQQHAQLAEANEALRELQDKKRELASLVVHDLRNPLSAVIGNVELLTTMIRDPDEDVKRVLSDMRELGFKALEMVAGLLDVEDLEEGLLIADPVEVAVDQFIHSISNHQRATALARELSLEFAVPNGMVAVFDRQLISRVVENLVDNSVRYAPYGGRVRISAELADETLILRVGNDGPPVPEAERAKLFDRYYRLEARRAGARANRGLGLYFCKLAVEAHSGTIRIEEMPEYPACFAVLLPQKPLDSDQSSSS